MRATIQISNDYGHLSVEIRYGGNFRTTPCANDQDAQRTYHAYHKLLSDQGYAITEK